MSNISCSSSLQTPGSDGDGLDEGSDSVPLLPRGGAAGIEKGCFLVP